MAIRTRHFKEVPDQWKEPFGPYRQAPKKYGGEWWFISPFSSLKPWLHLQGSTTKKAVYPEGFIDLFGEMPQWKSFVGTGSGAYRQFQGIKGIWETELKYYKGLSIPEWVTQEQLDTAHRLLQKWGMGIPTYYEARYGHLGRLVNSEAPDYDAATYHIINFPNHLVAQVQVKLFQRGILVKKWHPFVPPALFSISEGEE